MTGEGLVLERLFHKPLVMSSNSTTVTPNAKLGCVVKTRDF